MDFYTQAVAADKPLKSGSRIEMLMGKDDSQETNPTVRF